MSFEPQGYHEKPGEELVLEGYRIWNMGILTGDISYCEDSWNMFAVAFGVKKGRLVLDALLNFIKTLKRCAGCPLKTNPIGCAAASRDEVLILGLISAIQFDDQTTMILCLDELACPSRCIEIMQAAEILATTFKCMGKALRPVPAETIRSVITDKMSNTTLH